MSFFSSPHNARATNSAEQSYCSDVTRVFLRSLFDPQAAKA
jgi:hypothetical protein